MTRRIIGAAALACLHAGPLLAQAVSPPPQLTAATHTAYSKNTELFAEWRPLIAGQARKRTE
jgi:hypothetical protein